MKKAECRFRWSRTAVTPKLKSVYLIADFQQDDIPLDWDSRLELYTSRETSVPVGEHFGKLRLDSGLSVELDPFAVNQYTFEVTLTIQDGLSSGSRLNSGIGPGERLFLQTRQPDGATCTSGHVTQGNQKTTDGSLTDPSNTRIEMPDFSIPDFTTRLMGLTRLTRFRRPRRRASLAVRDVMSTGAFIKMPVELDRSWSDILAQSTCTAMNTDGGWTYAVRRRCGAGGATCQTICADGSLKAQDPDVSAAASSASCVNSLHVYRNRPLLDSDNTKDLNKLSLKIYRYNSCAHADCGPNYCCCRFQY